MLAGSWKILLIAGATTDLHNFALHKKRQRTNALHDAGALNYAPLIPRGFGVRLSSAAFTLDRPGCTTYLIKRVE